MTAGVVECMSGRRFDALLLLLDQFNTDAHTPHFSLRHHPHLSLSAVTPVLFSFPRPSATPKCLKGKGGRPGHGLLD
jgi:hypothetical protein